ncbi:hypothetical protein C8R45DRAFT_943862 [Mycena sanguinolenta]|nr:hypothetical protein C8R45DRAFT_943862 [Mycena sanguinolenta]
MALHDESKNDILVFPPEWKLVRGLAEDLISGEGFRSVHNVDATWGDRFTVLKLRHGLDINNICNAVKGLPADMYVNGVHGEQLLPEEEDLGDEELEVYGIDWQGLQEDRLYESQAQNNPTSKESSS